MKKLAVLLCAFALGGCASDFTAMRVIPTKSEAQVKREYRPHAVKAAPVARPEITAAPTAPAQVVPDAAPMQPKKKGWWKRLKEKLHHKKKAAE